MDYLPLMSFIEVNTYLTCKEIKMKMVTNLTLNFQMTYRYFKLPGIIK